MRPPVVSTLKHILFAKNWVVRARDIDKTLIRYHQVFKNGRGS